MSKTATASTVRYLKELIFICSSKGVEVPVDIIDLSKQKKAEAWLVSQAIDDLKMELGW